MNASQPDQEYIPATLGAHLLAENRKNPGNSLLFLRSGLAATSAFDAAIRMVLDQVLEHTDAPVVLTALSNAEHGLNPFAGLETSLPSPPGTECLEGLVALLGHGEILETSDWPDHVALFSPAAIDLLATPDTTVENALSRLQMAGGRLLLSDSIFLHDPGQDLFYRKALEPHEERHPTAWGVLTRRLDRWLNLDTSLQEPKVLNSIAEFNSSKSPATLHVTHSWGGGVAQWVHSFVDADGSGPHFQLRSEGPQSGLGCGQRLCLYLGNQLDAPVAQWWLQPPIGSSCESNRQYRKILAYVQSRYGIGRILISSLVGHSLDALATGLPTTQIIHDFYPVWPLLGIHPAPYLEEGKPADLETALAAHSPLPEFRNRDAGGWQTLGSRWREQIINFGVAVAAPSQSAADLLRRLDPAWLDIEIEIVPHGVPDIPGETEVLPRDREDGRLRLVVPGRIQEGKGRNLLLEALPELAPYAQIYLLGSGKDGELFFGQTGVDVVIQYDREQLRDLLATIGPHAACLLSVVPETYSFTLSEMQQLDIPVIATRVGSLQERIRHGETGWLVEPDAASLVSQVKSLAADPKFLRSTRERLKEFELPGTERVVEKYAAICQTRPAGKYLAREQDIEAAQTAGWALLELELEARVRSLEDRIDTLRGEVDKRTAWAEEREQALKEEVDRRVRWVSGLENQLESARDALTHEQTVHRQTNQRLEDLRSIHDTVLGSLSWRMTRPLRILRRTFRNLSQARAWNPLRWPLLLSQSVRTVKTHGLRGSLVRAQRVQDGFTTPEGVVPADIESIGNPEPPSRFPEVAEPQVSVIIPAFNKWLYTAACLRSLAESDCNTAFEVIVVDDRSDDETDDFLARTDGLVRIRNDKNMGFVESCNRGAEVARGNYLVFLNNDTQVTDGWLDALQETFRSHPDTGLAGARLIYPNGELQEAGGIVFRDGSGWNYGKGDDPDRPDYGYAREADYCSGACIMMKNDLYRELGGFDTHFAPAYYEDTDLAFRVRSRGLKVRVQPAANIIHHEGITSGTDINSGTKRYQATNREKFLERWRDELDSFPEPITDPGDIHRIRDARDHHLRGRVLVVDAYTPEPDQDSGSVRLRCLMDCMVELGYGVTFLPDNRVYAGEYSRQLQQTGIEAVYNPWIGSLQRFFAERGGDFDFVMISRHYVAANYLSLLKKHCPRAKFIFDTVDLHYLREERQAELEDSLPLKRSAAQTRRSELAVIETADATLVVSPVEKSVLEEAAPDARVHVISNVHDAIGSQRPFGERSDIFFVGGYQHPPNIDAASWFVGSIWPLIRDQLPEMKFHLIGSKAPERVRALHGEGVHFHGFVKSMDPWLDGCRLAVAPLRFGAGVKGKVNQSMARGQPVVATPIAVEGLQAQADQDILVAESVEEFAAEVIRLYQDEALWNRVSNAGLENVRRYFSIETARNGLEELFDSLGQG